MRSILVSSTELYSGKSALCMALAMKLKENELKVGYMKPVGNIIVDVNGELVDDDALNMKKMLGLDENLDEISPILFTHQLLEDVLEGKDKQLVPKLEKTFKHVSRNKDVVILEGAGDVSGSSVLGLSDSEVARITGSKILLVSKYCDEFTVDRITTYMKLLSSDVEVLGIIFNNTSMERMNFVKEKVVPYFDRKGIKVLGVLPRNRALQTISAREIAEGLNGEVLAGKNNLDVTVDGIVVGALAADSAIKVFRRKHNRAVVTGGDRADLQIAALEARMRIMILSGNLYPPNQVLGRAEELGVPVILTTDDTTTLVDRMEQLLRTVRVKNVQKIDLMKNMFDENVDTDRILKSLSE
ncbi:phosphotransacetylase family protein [Methanocella sp. MCL-LM]|uniref:phosphotransacetylase family protein n=1 Tax=Methanocella sp. MCL-LM TaxID=3412035 RepID=UPI003C710A6F